MTKSNTHSIPTSVSLLAGITAGAIEGTLTYPSEYLKTRVQLSSKPTSLLSIFRSTLKTHGIAGIYKGVTPQITGTALKAGVRFMSFEFLREKIFTIERFGAASTILAGLGCGAIEAVIAVTPTESVKYSFLLFITFIEW